MPHTHNSYGQIVILGTSVSVYFLTFEQNIEEIILFGQTLKVPIMQKCCRLPEKSFKCVKNWQSTVNVPEVKSTENFLSVLKGKFYAKVWKAK